jgi:hypothetical protein
VRSVYLGYTKRADGRRVIVTVPVNESPALTVEEGHDHLLRSHAEAENEAQARELGSSDNADQQSGPTEQAVEAGPSIGPMLVLDQQL